MKQIISLFIALQILTFPIFVHASDIIYKSATEYDYPPFSVTDKGEADGFSVELLKAVADVMDLEITFKIDEWSVLKEELQNGELDVLPLVGYTEERNQHYDFTVPYVVMNGNIFIREDETKISTEADLYDKEIIVMKGDNAHEYAVRMGFSENLVLTNTYKEAFELLSSGKHDAILAQSLVGEQLIEKLNIKNIRAATQVEDSGLRHIRTNLTGFEQKFSFAVTKGNAELLKKLNEGLAIVSASGEFDRLYKKWFPFTIDNKPKPVEVLIVSLIVMTPIVILVLIIGMIYIRRKIKQKTEELEISNKSLLEMEVHLRSQQKLEAIGVLASGVAHEINNPINGVLNYGQLIYDLSLNFDSDFELSKDLILNYSNEIIRESNRISSIVSNLLQISRSSSKKLISCEVDDIINRILGLVTTIITQDHIKIEINIDKNIPNTECREQELQQVILNLIVNAKDALNARYEGYHENKKIIVTATEIELSNKEKGVRITVEDFGNGIPKDIQSKIFDPFFTTKSRSEGTGLGLTNSYGIIREHNGTLSFDTKEGEFTRFIIDLPVKQP